MTDFLLIRYASNDILDRAHAVRMPGVRVSGSIGSILGVLHRFEIPPASLTTRAGATGSAA